MHCRNRDPARNPAQPGPVPAPHPGPARRGVAQHICRAHRAQCRFTLEPGHPALYNHAGITAQARAAVKQVAGLNGVTELERPMMTGEDFTSFPAAVPACFFRVGGRNAAKGFVHGWHHPAFDFDEAGLVTGAAVLTQTALNFLSK